MKKEEILQQLDFARVYQHYFPDLNASTGWINVNSPFREDRVASFSINLDNGAYNDFGDSSQKGDVFSFVQQIEKFQSFPDTLKFISERFTNLQWKDGAKKKLPEKKQNGNGKLEPIPAKQIQVFIENLQKHRPKQISEILKERKIDLDLCRQLAIGAASMKYRDKANQYHVFDTIIIPYDLDKDGNAVYWKRIPYLNKKSQKQFIRTRGMLTIFPQQFLHYKGLVLCEGELDALSLLSNGINAVSGTTGAGSFSNWSEIINKFRDKNITILYDRDEAGEKNSGHTAKNLIQVSSSVKIAKWDRTDTGYDVGDFFAQNRDFNELTSLIETAQDYILKKDNEKIKEEISEFIYNEKQNLKQNILVDYLISDYYRDVKKRLILCSSIDGAKKYFYLYRDGFWRRTNREVIKRHIYRLLKHPFTAHTVNSIADLLMANVYIDFEKLNARQDLINLQNCTFDLVNYKRLEHNPEYYFTFKNSYDYELGAKCPEWDKAIWEYSLGDANWVRCLWEIFGYSLTGVYDIQKMFWFEGAGGTGKSTTTRVLQNLVGHDLTRFNFNPNNLTGRFYNKELIGKRIAITGDLDNYLMNINIIKMLTGGDKQTTDIKHGDEVVFENTAKIIFCMNTLPQIPSGETIQPFLRRILILPFHHSIKKYDFGIEKKFEYELSGIFNKAIEGLKRLRQSQNEFALVKRGDNLLRFYELNINMFESFCSDELVEDKNDSVYNWEIWDRYKEYMDERAAPHWDSDRTNIRDMRTLGAKIKNKFKSETERKSTIIHRLSGIRKGRYTLYHGIRLARDSDYDEKEQQLIEDDTKPVF